MGEDWQKGDDAMCIKVGPWENEALFGHPGPKGGVVYRVLAVAPGNDGIGEYLAFDHWPMDQFASRHFTKLRPHTPDAEDRETIRLLNQQPAPVDANLRTQIHHALRHQMLGSVLDVLAGGEG